MSDLTAKFVTLEAQLATQAATMEGYVDTVEAKLQLLADNLDTIIINNAANTKALLAAIGQSAACFPCPTPSIVVPPIDTTVNPVNDERCQRSQAFVATISDILTAMDTLQSFNVVGTYSVLHDTISEVISGIAAGDTVPLPSFPETVNIVGNYISYAGERLFSGVSLMEQFSPLQGELITAMHASTTAEEARSLYNGVIGASAATNTAQLLFEAVAYSALYSYFFDPGTDPDLSAFDGALCGVPEGCMLLYSQPVEAIDGSYPELFNRQMVVIPDWNAYGLSFLSTTFSEYVVHNGGETGGTITQKAGGDCRIVYHDGSGNHSTPLVVDTPFTIPAGTDSFFLDDVTPGLTLSGAFSIIYCPPLA